MKSTSAEIYVFSGTGNTFLLVDSIKDIFTSNNCPTMIHPIPGKFYPPAEDSLLGLAFTTAWFSSYPFVLDFIKKLPEGNGREVFLVSSMAGSNFNMSQPIRKLLIKKGYNPIGSRVVKMPSNYGKSPSEKSISNQELIKAATVQAANYAGQLLTGKSKWPENKAPWSTFFYKFAQTKYPWAIFRNLFGLQINISRCSKCGFCQSICPVGAIDRNNNTYTITDKCVSCQHCAAFCPEKAIGIGGEGGNAYKTFEYKKMLELFRNEK